MAERIAEHREAVAPKHVLRFLGDGRAHALRPSDQRIDLWRLVETDEYRAHRRLARLAAKVVAEIDKVAGEFERAMHQPLLVLRRHAHRLFGAEQFFVEVRGFGRAAARNGQIWNNAHGVLRLCGLYLRAVAMA